MLKYVLSRVQNKSCGISKSRLRGMFQDEKIVVIMLNGGNVPVALWGRDGLCGG
jgi:hypothetical protein